MKQPKDIAIISPHEAKAKINQGAALVDVREYQEWLQNHVAGATLIPLGNVKGDPECAALANEVVLLCRSGKRATEAAQHIAAKNDATVFVVQGGIEGWKSAGLPTQSDATPTFSIERQVRIGAGALVLLGLLVNPIRPLSYFVACGLIFAGITDWCGMGKILSKMPWNRPRGDEKERSLKIAGSIQSQGKQGDANGN